MKHLVRIFLLLNSLCCFSQNETNNWYFGFKAGIDFNSSPPIALSNGSLMSGEGCSSISDGNGNLLFYTAGDTIWNAMHLVMANGAGLLGNSSACQSSIIIQKPGSDSLYYVFTLDAQAGTNGLRYSIVDMSLAAGNGSVITKNVLLYTPSTEKLAATKHCNGKDAWILSHECNSANFRAYLLTSSGINPSPVISQAGSSVPNWGFSSGQMKVSPNGRKVGQAVADNYTFEVFDFDNSTGLISNSLSLGSFTAAPYGCEFSPDGSKFYGCSWYAGSQIYQWDLCAGSNSAIIASKTSISTSTLGTSSLQLASDGRIYAAKYLTKPFVDAIYNPDLLGMLCNYVDTAILLSPGQAYYGLPNFMSNYLKPLTTSFTYTDNSVTSCNLVSFAAPPDLSPTCTVMGYPVNSLTWLFGDPLSGTSNTSTLSNPAHVFSSPGVYTVKLALNYNCSSDTIVKQINISSVPSLTVSGVFNACAGDQRVYTVTGASSYSWSQGVNGSAIVLSPTATTIYTVTGSYSSSACKSSNVFTVNVSPCSGIHENVLVNGPDLKIYPNPSDADFTIESTKEAKLFFYDQLGRLAYSLYVAEGVNHIRAGVLQNGMYFIKSNVEFGRIYKLVKMH